MSIDARNAKEFTMPRSYCAFFPIGLALCAVLGLDAAGRANEPRVTFALNAGWVDCSVRHDGKPLAGAIIQILDERGVKFAEGETGPGGETAFPMPAGSSCIVEIKTGERTADPIRLIKTDSGVEPARVLLSYGLRPCCRSKLIKPEPVIAGHRIEAPAEATEFSFLWASLAAILFGSGVATAQVWWLRRRYTNPPDIAAKEKS
jgi:hypothetical protein